MVLLVWLLTWWEFCTLLMKWSWLNFLLSSIWSPSKETFPVNRTEQQFNFNRVEGEVHFMSNSVLCLGLFCWPNCELNAFAKCAFHNFDIHVFLSIPTISRKFRIPFLCQFNFSMQALEISLRKCGIWTIMWSKRIMRKIDSASQKNAGSSFVCDLPMKLLREPSYLEMMLKWSQGMH